MAIANFTDLKATAADWLNRTDLTAQIPDFITLAEAEITRRLRRKTIRTTISISAVSTTLPAACAEMRSIYLETATPGRDIPLYETTLEMLAERRASRGAVAGRPTHFAVVNGTELVVDVTPDATYTARVAYFEKLVPLATSPTNSTLTDSPDLYLFGTLKHSAMFLQHDERIAVWKQGFEDALLQLETAREREETNASLRPIRLPRVFGVRP